MANSEHRSLEPNELNPDRKKPENFSRIRQEVLRAQETADFSLNDLQCQADLENWRDAVNPYLSEGALAWIKGLRYEKNSIPSGFSYVRDNDYFYDTYSPGDQAVINEYPVPAQKPESKTKPESIPEIPAPTMTSVEATDLLFPMPIFSKDQPKWNTGEIISEEFRALRILFPKIPAGHCDYDVKVYNGTIPNLNTLDRLCDEADREVEAFSKKIEPLFTHNYESEDSDGGGFRFHPGGGGGGGTYIDKKGLNEAVWLSPAGQLQFFRKVLFWIYESSLEGRSYGSQRQNLENILRRLTPKECWTFAHSEQSDKNFIAQITTQLQTERDARRTPEERKRREVAASTINFYVRPRGGKRHNDRFIRVEGARVIRQGNFGRSGDHGLCVDLVPEIPEWRLYTQPTKDELNDGGIRIFGPAGEIFDEKVPTPPENVFESPFAGLVKKH